jgi:hypothetical protein
MLSSEFSAVVIAGLEEIGKAMNGCKPRSWIDEDSDTRLLGK